MRGKKGVILFLTVGFMLIFTLLGFGSMFMTGLQAQGMELKSSMTQAFWLAEAGIQRSMSHIYNNAPGFTLPGNLDPGTYSTVVTQINPVRWTMDSQGTVIGSKTIIKEILVQCGPDITNALTTSEAPNVQKHDAVTKDGVYDAVQRSLDFAGTFGISINGLKNVPGVHYYDMTKDTLPPSFSGITLVDNASGIVHTGGSGLLIFRVSGSVKFNGNLHFDGIIWIEGSMIDLGDTSVSGAVFVNNGSNSIKGSATITYDQAAIDAAFGQTNAINKFAIVSWQEKPYHVQ